MSLYWIFLPTLCEFITKEHKYYLTVTRGEWECIISLLIDSDGKNQFARPSRSVEHDLSRNANWIKPPEWPLGLHSYIVMIMSMSWHKAQCWARSPHPEAGLNVDLHILKSHPCYLQFSFDIMTVKTENKYIKSLHWTMTSGGSCIVPFDSYLRNVASSICWNGKKNTLYTVGFTFTRT